MLFCIYRASHRWSQRQAQDMLDYPSDDWVDEAPPKPCDAAVWNPTLAWWCLQLEALEDLIKLAATTGHAVITKKDGDNWVLVIYDAYVE